MVGELRGAELVCRVHPVRVLLGWKMGKVCDKKIFHGHGGLKLASNHCGTRHIQIKPKIRWKETSEEVPRMQNAQHTYQLGLPIILKQVIIRL